MEYLGDELYKIQNPNGKILSHAGDDVNHKYEVDKDMTTALATGMFKALIELKTLNAKMDVILSLRVRKVEQDICTRFNSTTVDSSLHRNVTGSVSRLSMTTTTTMAGRPSLSHLPVNRLSSTKALVSEFVMPENQILKNDIKHKLVIDWLYDNYERYKRMKSLHKSKSDSNNAVKLYTEESHDTITPKNHKTLMDVVKHDDYLHRYTTPRKQKLIPVYDKGTSKERNNLHHDKISSFAGEEKVKKMTTLDEFVSVKHNNEDVRNLPGEFEQSTKFSKSPNDQEEEVVKCLNEMPDQLFTVGIPPVSSSLYDIGNSYPALSNMPGDGGDLLPVSMLGCDEDDDNDVHAIDSNGNKKQYGDNKGLNHSSDATKLPCNTCAVHCSCTAGPTCIAYSDDSKDAQQALLLHECNDVIMSQAKATDKIETKLCDTSSLLVKPSYNTPCEDSTWVDQKRFDCQTVPSPKTDEKSHSSDEEDDSTTMSGSPRCLFLSSQGGYETGESENDFAQARLLWDPGGSNDVFLFGRRHACSILKAFIADYARESSPK